MAKDLKRLYRLREMAINIPDEDMTAFRRIVGNAVKAGELPPSAKTWAGISKAPKFTPDDEPQASTPVKPARAAKGTKAPKAGPPPIPQTDPAVKAAMGQSASAWDKLGGEKPVNPARSTPEPIDLDLDDPWFKNDPDKKKSASPPPIPKAALQKGKSQLAPNLPAPPSAATKLGKGSPNFKPQINWSKDSAISGEFPELPEPQSAATDVSNDDDYKSPFGNIGGGGSSWDDMPAWARDPEKMPRVGGNGSMPIPGSQKPDAPKGKGPSPVGAQWTDKDVKSMNKKPGMLSRFFGKKGKD